MSDLIDRNLLYHDMTMKRLELHEKGLSWSEFCRGFSFAMEFVKQAPSAEPERKTGKWIKEYWNGEHTRKCSACNITQTVTTYWGKVNFNYCPYCGTKMEGES